MFPTISNDVKKAEKSCSFKQIKTFFVPVLVKKNKPILFAIPSKFNPDKEHKFIYFNVGCELDGPLGGNIWLYNWSKNCPFKKL